MSPTALFLALLHGAAGALPGGTPPDATSTVIAVVLPAAPDASMLEALSRLRGEADSVGFELRLVPAEPGIEPRAELDRVARELAPAAVVALVGKPGAEAPGPERDRLATSDPSAPAPATPASVRSVDVWFLDRGTGGMSLGQLTIEEEAGTRGDLALAVRVVDFIRARMFDSLVRAQAAARADRPAPVRHALAGRYVLAAGLDGTGSFAGFDAAWLPTLELGYAARSWLRLTVAIAGLGTEPSRRTKAGSATMDQRLCKLGMALLGRPRWRLQPLVEVSAIAYFLSVRGEGYSGYVGYRPSSWSPGAQAQTGLALLLGRHVFLQLAGGALLLFREPTVHVADVEVARTGRPAWLATLLLGATL